ncbi:MAG TPA: hypothetical protein VM735_00185 [Candidatus Kapabacteria bacterium]|nr:hypothetical protein [Candidatus Kapabacteria bacterium]
MHSETKSSRRRLAWKLAGFVIGALVILGIILALAPSDNLWLETKRKLEARGEVLDWEKFIPPELPPDQNFFADPVAAILLPIKGQPTTNNYLDIPELRHPTNSVDLGIPFSVARLAELPRESSADEKLSLTALHDWFAQWDDALAQLRKASERPHARLNGEYASPVESPILNFVSVRNLAQVISSRAKVNLLLGDSAAAFEDLETLQVVMRSLQAQPGTLVSAMIHVAVSGLYLETIEEGLRRNIWSQEELRKLIPQLTQSDLLISLKQAIRSERAAVVRILTALTERKRDPLYKTSLDAFNSDEWRVRNVILRFSPPSRIRNDQAKYALLIQDYLDAIVPSERRVDTAQVARANAHLSSLRGHWYFKYSVLAYVIPVITKSFATATRCQGHADQLAIACALELFHAHNKSYPSDLGQLVPAYIGSIPKNIDYQRTEDGYELLDPKTSPSQGSATLPFIWKKK